MGKKEVDRSVKVKIYRKDFYCKVELTGDVRLDQVPSALWKEVRRYCQERNLEGVLLEDKVSGRPSIMNMYDLINNVAPFLRGLTIACTGLHTDHARFGEDVAYNRGISFKSFCNPDAAITYLMESSVPFIDANRQLI